MRIIQLLAKVAIQLQGTNMTKEQEIAVAVAKELEKKLNRDPRAADPLPPKDDRKASIQ